MPWTNKEYAERLRKEVDENKVGYESVRAGTSLRINKEETE